ncbi:MULTISPECIES: glycosyl transferase family protein [Ralstonia solanacearum species complex]|uniref:Glycosyl transferase family protein n=1 Tax=Ralstonia syzygii TaxID=28097 RepID=A0ABX7ZKL4_9RALS|nr:MULTISPECIES: glycosyl transferase family protein [Ralstonia solanacearum species complex]BEU74066.1 cyclic di-3',5'-guanylate-activated glycosyltransferase NrfB [Ralstonia pseudosolanacearum]AXV78967.1 phage receptor protein [Ralstonia solanacearum]AXV92985.1 phage receptor protein [Ralstonia solanacearum]AXW21049.1 phage receptor protein [Ralstonia solanacearum]AXW77882.1 phage receptor protein [Ralstonia solanacearum]
MSHAVWEAYLALLNTMTVATALVILISTADDFFLDAFYWVRELWLWHSEDRRLPATISAQTLREREERYLAIMVPAWKEYDVIAKMVENTLATMEYTRYIIFAGAYRNDAETTTEVDRMVRRYPGRVVRAAVTHDGPTCKADCLNTIIQTIVRYEAGHGIRFAGVIMHDCEDVIHPLELKYFNYFIGDQDLVQLPVLSLERKWYEWVAGTYMDDFSETHQKDLVAREALTGTVPGAGVALCYSRRAIEAVMKVRGDTPFNTGTLTEDYDFSFRLRELGMREAFVRFPICETTEPATDASGKLRTRWRLGRRRGVRPQLLATREYFPSTFRTAYRQRARWILGIAFQGWLQMGWDGDLVARYFFFRDRKGVVTALFSIFAYVLSLNYLMLAWAWRAGWLHLDGAQFVVASSWMQSMLAVNAVLLFNRLAQRVYFVGRLNGPLQGMLCLPRLVINNFINFFSVCRAWKIFLIYCMTGKPIAWDKTQHTYLSNDALGRTRCRLGETLIRWEALTQPQLDQALAIQQQTGKRLGQILLQEGMVTPDTLADALAEQADLPRVSLTNVVLGALVDCLPRDLAVRHHVVPFSIGEDGSLNIAVSELPDGEVLEELARAAGRKVACFMACDHEMSAELAWMADPNRRATVVFGPSAYSATLAVESLASVAQGAGGPAPTAADAASAPAGHPSAESPHPNPNVAGGVA